MAEFFGRTQFGGNYFHTGKLGAPHPSFNPGFERLAPPQGQVIFSMGVQKNAPGTTTEINWNGGVQYRMQRRGGLRRKRY